MYNYNCKVQCKFFYKQIICILLVFLSVQAFAQYTGYKPVANVPEFKKQFAQESSKITSITSAFTQEKILIALTEKITSTGTFKFKRNNKVRIEYIRPFTYLMIMNGDKMLVRDDQKENRINVKSNKLFQQINRIMVDCIQGTIVESKDFTVKIYENEKTYLLEMTPTAKMLKEFFETIVVTIEKKDYSVQSIEMNEPAGDKTMMTFREKKINDSISDAVFAL
jgi:outer membrane lipoprotein-sorting protein